MNPTHDTANNWTIILAAIGGILTLVAGQVRGWYSDRAKARRDDAQVDALHNIASSNTDIRNGQIAQNGKLSIVVEVNKAYHDEIIRTLQACSYRTNPLQVTEKKQ